MSMKPVIEQYLDHQARLNGLTLDTRVAVLDRDVEPDILFEGDFDTTQGLEDLFFPLLGFASAHFSGANRVRALRALHRAQNERPESWAKGIKIKPRYHTSVPDSDRPETLWCISNTQPDPFVPMPDLERWVKAYGASFAEDLGRKAKAIFAATPKTVEAIWTFKTRNYHVELLKTPADDYLMPEAWHLQDDSSGVDHMSAMADMVAGRRTYFHLEVRVYDISAANYDDDSLLSSVSTDPYNEDFHTVRSQCVHGPIVTSVTTRDCQATRQPLVREAIMRARKKLAERQQP